MLQLSHRYARSHSEAAILRRHKISSEHDYPDAATSCLIDNILRIHTSGYRRCSVVVEVEMQLTVSGCKLQVFEEQGVVQKSQSIEDIEIELSIL